MFVNVENQFKYGVEGQKIKNTWLAMCTFINLEKNALDGNKMINILIIAARLGISSTNGKLNDSERRLAEAIFGGISEKHYEEAVSLMGQKVTDDDYRCVDFVCELETDAAMAFLKMILGFAYIDECVDDTVLDKLDRKFGMVLLSDFLHSGQESVPEPMVRLTDCENEIFEWIDANGDSILMLFDEIKKHFNQYSEVELKEILDSLCEKDVLTALPSALGTLYKVL
jgi:hypothetical protein